VKEWFVKLDQGSERATKPRKLYLYIKPKEPTKKVADHQKKQWEAQKKPALSDYNTPKFFNFGLLLENTKLNKDLIFFKKKFQDFINYCYYKMRKL